METLSQTIDKKIEEAKKKGPISARQVQSITLDAAVQRIVVLEEQIAGLLKKK